MNKLYHLGLRITPEMREALMAAAKQDRRSVSGLVEKILADWLSKEGWLAKLGRRPRIRRGKHDTAEQD